MEQQNNEQKFGALETIMLRNAFYRDSYRCAVFLLLLMVILNILLVGCIFYRCTHPPEPEYFAANPDGRMIKWHPLSDPVVSDDYVLQWSADAIRKVFSLDYVHWRQQLQDAASAFNSFGWDNFLQALKSSNNLETLKELKMVSTAEITGAPEVEHKEVVDGHYAWKIKMPILVSFTSSSRTINVPMMVTLIVLREPVKDYPQGIAINNFLPETTQQSY